MISAPIRVGGAFLAIAVVLLIFTIVEIITHGWLAPFAVTPRFLCIVAAAALLGSFATISKTQKPSRTQVIALAGAVGLVIIGRLLPGTIFMVWGQYWLPTYAAVAFLCALILRRAQASKS